jgi:hypothetical protein
MSDLHNKLEEWLVGKFQEVDPKARKTPGSGCGNSCGDISNQYCYVEAKMKHGQENIIVKLKEEWNHLLFKMPLKTEKFPIVFVEQMYGEKFAILKAEDFFTLLKEAKNG